MEKLISFIVDKDVQIIIYSRSLKDVEAYSGELCVNLDNNEESICLAHKITLFDLEHTVLDLFKKVFNQKLKIPREVNDLGIEFNSYWLNVSQDKDNMEQTSEPFELFQCSGLQLNDTITFLFNDDKENILFQVSSKYPYFFSLEQAPVSYEEWLPSYKIVYKKEISFDVMQEWIIQLESFNLKLRSQVNNR